MEEYTTQLIVKATFLDIKHLLLLLCTLKATFLYNTGVGQIGT
jgi:hypothetical protein